MIRLLFRRRKRLRARSVDESDAHRDKDDLALPSVLLAAVCVGLLVFGHQAFEDFRSVMSPRAKAPVVRAAVISSSPLVRHRVWLDSSWLVRGPQSPLPSYLLVSLWDETQGAPRSHPDSAHLVVPQRGGRFLERCGTDKHGTFAAAQKWSPRDAQQLLLTEESFYEVRFSRGNGNKGKSFDGLDTELLGASEPYVSADLLTIPDEDGQRMNLLCEVRTSRLWNGTADGWTLRVPDTTLFGWGMHTGSGRKGAVEAESSVDVVTDSRLTLTSSTKPVNDAPVGRWSWSWSRTLPTIETTLSAGRVDGVDVLDPTSRYLSTPVPEETILNADFRDDQRASYSGPLELLLGLLLGWATSLATLIVARFRRGRPAATGALD